MILVKRWAETVHTRVCARDCLPACLPACAFLREGVAPTTVSALHTDVKRASNGLNHVFEFFVSVGEELKKKKNPGGLKKNNW